MPQLTDIRRARDFIMRELGDTDQPVVRYVWRAWLLSIVPTGVIGLLTYLLLGDPPNASALDLDPELLSQPLLTGALWVLAPWIETLMMWPILFVLKRVVLGGLFWVAVDSGLIWGCLHALDGTMWGTGQAWGFFVFSACFLEWEKKSKASAIIMTATLHSCHNMIVLVLFAVVLLLG